ncbi:MULTISPECIES: hypothetical protein [unclassified Serratia (in: enterobacteria)]|uniref:hypothetical protein n=1 Tax=unclassified Serratia (in: enterobacteria) TaxID=2647522 RepID=UPI003076805E
MPNKSAAWLFGLLMFYFIFAMHISWPNRGGSGFYLPWNMVGMMVLALLVLATLLVARPPLAASRFFNWLAMGTLVLLLPLLWTRALSGGSLATPARAAAWRGGLLCAAAIPPHAPVAAALADTVTGRSGH